MRLNKLSLSHFRSYSQQELTFSPGTTSFIGENGAGKTNIIESMIYLSQLSSHRVSQNQPLLQLGAEQAVIRAEITNNDRKLTVDLEINTGRANRAKINGNPTRSQREILGALQAVYFSPEDLDLVRGEPAGRRDFLDKLLTVRTPRLAGVISDYEKVLKQRNALLKTRAPKNAVDPWTEQLISFGAELTAARIDLVEQLNPFVTANYRSLNEAKQATISYKSNTEGVSRDLEHSRSVLARKLVEVEKQELERGTSLVGPHRDDMHLHLGEFPAKGYASHGESWSMALSLKLGSFNLLQNDGSTPILILDDVFAELDSTRRQHLITATHIAEQTFITAAVEGDLPTDLTTQKYYVTPGEVRLG